MVLDHRGAPTEFVAVDNAPEGFRETIEDLRSARVDPVMQHCNTAKCPSCGTRPRTSRPARLPPGKSKRSSATRPASVSRFTCPRDAISSWASIADQELPHDRTELARMMSELQLFAVYAQEAAMRVLVPCRQEDKIPRLTADELDDGRQEGLGSRRHPESSGEHRADAYRQCGWQAGVCQCAPGGAKSGAPGAHPLTPLRDEHRADLAHRAPADSPAARPRRSRHGAGRDTCDGDQFVRNRCGVSQGCAPIGGRNVAWRTATGTSIYGATMDGPAKPRSCVSKCSAIPNPAFYII